MEESILYAIKRNKVLLITLSAYLIAAVAAIWFFNTDWTAIQTFVLIITGIIVLWYTCETMHLRDISNRQYRLQLRPFIIVTYNHINGWVEVKNVGNGVALNVKVSNTRLPHDKHLCLLNVKGGIDVMMPNETKCLETEFSSDAGKDVTPNDLFPSLDISKVGFTTSYDDCDFGHYTVIHGKSKNNHYGYREFTSTHKLG